MEKKEIHEMLESLFKLVKKRDALTVEISRVEHEIRSKIEQLLTQQNKELENFRISFYSENTITLHLRGGVSALSAKAFSDLCQIMTQLGYELRSLDLFNGDLVFAKIGGEE